MVQNANKYVILTNQRSSIYKISILTSLRLLSAYSHKGMHIRSLTLDISIHDISVRLYTNIVLTHWTFSRDAFLEVLCLSKSYYVHYIIQYCLNSNKQKPDFIVFIVKIQIYISFNIKHTVTTTEKIINFEIN